MAGFPTRITFRALAPGGPRTNTFPTTRHDKEIASELSNDAFWQIGGLNITSALVALAIAADGSKLGGGEVWNDSDDPTKRVTITHDATGEYQISCDATYPDWTGTPRAVSFVGGLATVNSATRRWAPQVEIVSATLAYIYTWSTAGTATDMPFTVWIL